MIKRPGTAIGTLVVPSEQCPAKTFLASDGHTYPGRSVFNHCQIVGSVARALINRYPHRVRDRLFPDGSELAAAAHDIGKVSPFFYEKLRRNFTARITGYPVLQGIDDPSMESQWGGHAGVSYVSAKAAGAPKYIPEILGQHHGSLKPGLDARSPNSEQFGGAPWHKERIRLIGQLKSALDAEWPRIETAAQSRLLAGLTTVSDWVGSGMFFEDPSSPWESAIGEALNHAGFVSPNYRRGLSLHDVFGFAPNSIQVAMTESVQVPGAYILEAPMGMGKTEGALYAAYRMLEAGEASGIYFALPTQITSNKIFDRFRGFLDRILDPAVPNRPMLLHSGAWLLENTDLGEEGQPGGSWFNHAKRGLLAPFAVGTIDQALMAAMAVRHGFVRTFGLAGKVVILDEVHTYDTYTGTIMKELVALLRELHCTVIILSATLTAQRRSDLLAVRPTQASYPLISALPNNQGLTSVSVDPPRDSTVSLERSDETAAINEAFERAERGEQVLWIENTVAEAQAMFRVLASRCEGTSVECGLLHSRFTRTDRQGIEDAWVSLLGKAGWERRAGRGRILIGTQVLEQSLDIDADFLVTRIAPIDFLLQRLGRLWRHADTPRPSEASREAWVLAPNNLEAAFADPARHMGASVFVYSKYVMCRTLETVSPRFSGSIQIPSDIPDLIEAVYADRPEQGVMSDWLRELDDGQRNRPGRRALSQLALTTLARPTAVVPDERATTRYGGEETVDVLILRSLERDEERCLTIGTLMNWEKLEIPWRRQFLSREGWRRLSAALMRETVPVPVSKAPSAIPESQARRLGFGHCFHISQQMEWGSLTIGLWAAASGSLVSIEGQQPSPRHHLYYDSRMGYCHEPRKA